MKKWGVIFAVVVGTIIFFPHSVLAVRVQANTLSGNTTEAGGTAVFTITLDEPIICPTMDSTCTVTIPISSSNTAEGTVSTSTVVFDYTEWYTVKTVTVTGVDDAIDDGDKAYTIVLGAVVSNSEYYSNYNPADVSATNLDNDTAGISVGSISGNTTEGGAHATFTIGLNSQPTDYVQIILASDNTAEGRTDVPFLTFTSETWNVPQTVTLTGQNDSIDDGDITYHVTLSPTTSNDTNYNAIQLTAITVVNTDNDAAGITVTPTGTTVTEASDTANLALSLASQPTADVTINLTNDDQITLSASSLTFTSANWSTAQTVTVSAVDDAIVEDTTTNQVNFVVTSTDSSYNNYAVAATAFTVVSDDVTALADTTPNVTSDGKSIRITVNTVVTDEKTVAKVAPQMYRLKTKAFHSLSGYTTVAYVRVNHHQAKLIVFRLGANNTLSHRVAKSFRVKSNNRIALTLAKHRHIIVTVGKKAQAVQRRWMLTSTGTLQQY